jgi:anaerobic selenocysteine-containing dehydrogenase
VARVGRVESFGTAALLTVLYGRDLLTGAESTEMEHRALTPAGRAFLLAAEYQPPHEVPTEKYPFSYTTGRTIYHSRVLRNRWLLLATCPLV